MRTVVLLVFLGSSIPAWAERFNLDHFSNLAQISNVRITPDGKRVLALVARGNLKENRFDQDLILVDLAGRTRTVLAVGSLIPRGTGRDALPVTDLRRADLSPQGDYVAFLRPVNGNQQIFLKRLPDGEAVQFSRAVARVGSFVWRPDGKAIAFTAPVEDRLQLFVQSLEGGEPRQLTHSVNALAGFTWQPDGQAILYLTSEPITQRADNTDPANRSFEADTVYLNTSPQLPSTTTLYLAAAPGGEARRLASFSGVLMSDLQWTGDGKRVSFMQRQSFNPRYNLQEEIRVLDVQSGEIAHLHPKHPQDTYPSYSPDGRMILFKRPRQGNFAFRDWWLESIGNGTSRNLTGQLEIGTEFDSGAQWLPGGRAVLVNGIKGTTSGFWRFSVSGEAERIPIGDLQVGLFPGMVAVSDAGPIAFVGSAVQGPPELYYLPRIGDAPVRISDFNAAVEKIELGRQESLEWKTHDGFDCDGVVVYPPGYQSGRAYPLVLEIHGGPAEASTLGFHARSQWLAAQGWIVFRPNYRGSTNRGWAFQNAVHNDAAAGPGKDIIAGVDLLIRKGIADPKRMAVSGWSYGGHMAVWLLAKYPERWRAGVAGAALVDHVDHYALSYVPPQVARAFGGSPFNDPKRLQAYREQSPITYAQNVKAPTLILHCTGDRAVPITEAYMLHHVFTDNGIPHQFIAYPLNGHIPFDPVHSRDVERRWAEWIKRHFE